MMKSVKYKVETFESDNKNKQDQTRMNYIKSSVSPGSSKNNDLKYNKYTQNVKNDDNVGDVHGDEEDYEEDELEDDFDETNEAYDADDDEELNQHKTPLKRNDLLNNVDLSNKSPTASSQSESEESPTAKSPSKTVAKSSGGDLNKHLIKNTETTSSSESGFGTVDDDIENSTTTAAVTNQQNVVLIINENSPTSNENVHQSQIVETINETKNNSLRLNNCQPLVSQKGGAQQEQKIDSNVSNNDLSNMNSNTGKQFPILQPPRQIIYELSKTSNNSNNNNSDDIINILNDNSSISSSISSESSFSNCCSSFMDKLMKFYYSCFCCYSTTSNTNQTPFIWSWLSIFCCCCPLLGGISLYLTHRSKKFKLKQKYDLAEKYSNYAEKLNIASLIFGVIFYAIAFFMITLVIFMYWRPNSQ